MKIFDRSRYFGRHRWLFPHPSLKLAHIKFTEYLNLVMVTTTFDKQSNMSKNVLNNFSKLLKSVNNSLAAARLAVCVCSPPETFQKRIGKNETEYTRQLIKFEYKINKRFDRAAVAPWIKRERTKNHTSNGAMMMDKKKRNRNKKKK